MVHRKYIDSHWLIFIFKGILALLFGWVALFNSGSSELGDILFLMSLTAVFLLGLSLIEFGNALNRAHQKTGWVVSVLIALFDAAVALALLFTLNLNPAVRLIILAGYVIIRGLCEIIIAFRTTVDPTDRFIWLLTGVCGAVMGIVILNSGHLANTDFIRFFGAYIVIIGINNLVYGVHNHSQQVEDRDARRKAAKKRSTTKSKGASKKTK